jgi:hypothetical protein
VLRLDVAEAKGVDAVGRVGERDVEVGGDAVERNRDLGAGLAGEQALVGRERGGARDGADELAVLGGLVLVQLVEAGEGAVGEDDRRLPWRGAAAAREAISARSKAQRAGNRRGGAPGCCR